MSALDVEALTVSYASRHGPVVALADFSLAVPEGRFTVLLGESGCGKTTALNSIAGLVRPDLGRISLGGMTLFQGAAGRRPLMVPPDRRDIGMVFQSYALWPHLSVLDNVMYPLRRRHVERREAERRALRTLATVRCEAYAERYPSELSGGQQQRIALARALVAEPKMLLFDEPLSNLDASLRRGLRDELARLHRELKFTAVYVTHDQSEALSLGTDIAVMDAGRIIQAGTPTVVYQSPANEFVARFFGANMVDGRVIERSGQAARIETPIGRFEAAQFDGGKAPPGEQVSVAFMPQVAVIEAAADGPLTVATVLYLGTHREIRLVAPGYEVMVTQPVSAPLPAEGEKARIRVASAQLHVYPRRT